MKNGVLCLIVVWAGVLLARGQATTPVPPSQAGRAIGVVTELRPGALALHTDAGLDLSIQLPEGVTVVRVPPGSKDLKAATKIAVTEISVGDRLLVRGQVSDGQKSVLAKSVIVMSHAELAKVREAESVEWRRRGLGGLVKAVDPATKQITISVPNNPPTPGNLTRPLIISVAPNTVLLRYAPDSVKFSDAKASKFEEIKVGDQVRALGTKSEDGSHLAAERLVSGTFHNISATVVSVDGQNGVVTVKDLATGKPLVVHTNADTQSHNLPPSTAQMIARFNSGGAPSEATAGQRQNGEAGRGGYPSNQLRDRAQAGGPGESGGWRGDGAPDLQRMIEHTPPLSFNELKPGDPLIVVSTEGAKPSEVTAIVVLSGVEPILAAQPKGGSEMVLGNWAVGMSEPPGGP